MDKSDDPTDNDDKSWLNWCLENAIGSINYDKPHRVTWTQTIPGAGSEYSNFPNYEQACIYVRDNLKLFYFTNYNIIYACIIANFILFFVVTKTLILNYLIIRLISCNY